jgi:hypothetical protein
LKLSLLIEHKKSKVHDFEVVLVDDSDRIRKVIKVFPDYKKAVRFARKNSKHHRNIDVVTKNKKDLVFVPWQRDAFKRNNGD